MKRLRTRVVEPSRKNGRVVGVGCLIVRLLRNARENSYSEQMRNRDPNGHEWINIDF